MTAGLSSSEESETASPSALYTVKSGAGIDCEDDASEEVIRNRIATYRAQTAVVADHYSAKGKYAEVDGLGSIDEVFDRICSVIDEA